MSQTRFDRRSIVVPSGAKVDVELLVPPDLEVVDLTRVPGPRSAPMLEQARAALHSWTPREEDEASALARLRDTREHRRGERGHAAPRTTAADRAVTSELDIARARAAEAQAESMRRGETPLDVDALRRLHAVAVGSESVQPWRRDVVWLGDSTGPDPRLRFQPAAPERIQPAMRALDQLLARSGDPIIVAALASAQLPAIHPWSDGNGRIGRLLGDLVLSRACDGGRAPDVARELALRWGDAAVVIDAWLIDGMLDEWIAVWCAALVRAADRPAGGVKTAGKWWRRRR